MILLASTSPTRQSMLRGAGLRFAAEAPQVDEKALVAANRQWQPAETAVKLAEAKALDVSRRHAGATVIGADQVLALGDKIFGKPRDREQCESQLLELRGKRHALVSAVVIAREGQRIWSYVDQAMLSMRNWSDGFLQSYLDEIGSDCTSSVGGYKIEGPGVQLFDKVEGDHFTILGLPLVPLLAQLRDLGELAS